MWDNIGVIPKGGMPCKDCERRGCGTYHDQCPEYKAYKEKISEVHKKYDTDRDKMGRSVRAENPKSSPNSIMRTHRHRQT